MEEESKPKLAFPQKTLSAPHPPTFPFRVTACPWCDVQWAKNEACNWVCCGLIENNTFLKSVGCGRQFCFECGKRLCGLHFDPSTGKRVVEVSTTHTKACCDAEAKKLGVAQDEYCKGGHNSHKPPT